MPTELTAGQRLAVVQALSPAQTLALTMWAEARSRLEPHVGWVANDPQAMADIANVVVNRAQDHRWATTGIKGICLAPFQFSCWLPYAGADNNHDPQHLADNYEALIAAAQQMLAGQASGALATCLSVATAACAGATADALGGATHYFADWIAPPKWAAAPAHETVARWGHHFWAGVA